MLHLLYIGGTIFSALLQIIFKDVLLGLQIFVVEVVSKFAKNLYVTIIYNIIVLVFIHGGRSGLVT